MGHIVFWLLIIGLGFVSPWISLAVFGMWLVGCLAIAGSS